MSIRINTIRSDDSIMKRALKSVGVSMLVTVSIVGLCSIAVLTDRVPEEGIGHVAIAAQLASVLVGTIVIRSEDSKQYMTVFSGVPYIAVLFAITALFFEGQYSDVWCSLLAVIIAGFLGMLMKNGIRRGGRLRRRKIRRR